MFSIYVLSIFLGASGAWVISHHADRMGLVDCPNERSSHCSPTPRGGGIGILSAFLVFSIANDLVISFWLSLGVLSMFSLFGDRVDLSAKPRLYVQLLLIAFLVAYAGKSPSYPLVYLPWILFWTVYIVGTANFYNFMDGINGIAGISGVVGFGLLSLYLSNKGNTPLFSVSICLSLACLGFLPFNIPKAKVFMGDVGSILLGASFAGIVFLSSDLFLDFVCMTSFLFPFYADELTTMLVRLREGQDLMQPHRKHFYQLLANEKEVPHWKVSITYGCFQTLVGISTLVANPYGIGAVLIILSLYFVVFTLVSSHFRLSVAGMDKH